MRLSDLFQSTGVKLAVACTAFFCLASLVTAGAAYYLIADDLDTWLDRSITETSSYLLDEFREGGEKSLAESVDQHAGASEGDDSIYVLVDGQGKKIAGNAKKFIVKQGWYDARPQEFGLTGGRSFRVLGQAMGADTLIIARSDTALDEIGAIIEKAFAVGAIIMGISALLTGLLIGFRAQKRVESFSKTLDAVSLGDMYRRIEVGPAGGDDIDHIARKLNKTLDNLSSAMLSMQHVTVDIAHDLKSPIARLRNRLTDCLASLGPAGLDPLNPAAASLGPSSPGPSNTGAENDARKNLQEAIGEADNITHTFDAMLRIAQIESGERRKNFTVFAVSDVVARAVDLYGVVVEDRGGRLNVAIDRSAASDIFGDAQLVLQMLSNLIENSVRHGHMPTTVSIAVRPLPDGILLAVADNGPGIPEGEWENVKERFYRLDKSRTTKGSGLGLALVAAVAKLHGADFALGGNAPGLVATITFLPLER